MQKDGGVIQKCKFEQKEGKFRTNMKYGEVQDGGWSSAEEDHPNQQPAFLGGVLVRGYWEAAGQARGSGHAQLTKLAGGHSKCATEVHHLETGKLRLRHILTYLRLMYHHHILTRNYKENISKTKGRHSERWVVWVSPKILSVYWNWDERGGNSNNLKIW